MIPEPPFDAPKGDWRRWARARRGTVDFAAVSAAIVAHIAASDVLRGTVLTYLAMGDEVDLSALREQADVRWAVTRTPDTGPLSVHLLGGPMERHPMGFEQPAADADEISVTELDVLLLPGLAYDRHGGRLGRGRGYIDGLLSTVRGDAVAVGVAPEAVIVDRLPMEAHDRRVNMLVSERGIQHFATRRSE